MTIDLDTQAVDSLVQQRAVLFAIDQDVKPSYLNVTVRLMTGPAHLG